MQPSLPMTLEEMDLPEGHEKLMQSQWRDFAAFAWDHYSTEGRGAVVVDFRNVSEVKSGHQVPTYYVAEGSERLAKLGGWPDDEVARAIQEYDPEQDVLFIFLRRSGDFLYYVASDDPAPPFAREMKRSMG